MTIENNDEQTPSERFDALADVFLRMDVYTSPAELHGLLCAKLVSDINYGLGDWLQNAAVFLEQQAISIEVATALITSEYNVTRGQLSEGEFALELVLPADEEEVVARVESIGRWCVGFVAGVDRSKTGQLSEEAKESLNDLNEIANIEIPEGAGDGAEQDLMEVVEYVRLAAVMIFMEMNPRQGAAEDAPQTLH